MKALLALEDGRVFPGYAFGSPGEACGEVVFNTSMAGYQEILTDPSYHGQIVTMTYPLIGNYGVNPHDIESDIPRLSGFIVREKSTLSSNWRAEGTLDDYLSSYNILGLERVDTRALTRHIREKGSMRGVISTSDLNPRSLVEKACSSPLMEGRDLAGEVTVSQPYWWQEIGHTLIAVIDCGVKWNILRHLATRRCRVKVYPCTWNAERVLSEKPDGILFSNGPGDPAALPYVVETAKKAIGRVPVFGICLGHQVVGQALGGNTYKLKFGHHGGNHPVKNLTTGRISITSQNHGFTIDAKTLPHDDVEVTYINLNDQTIEGLRHHNLPVFSVQFHPEAGPGPNDTTYIFDQFITMVEANRAKKG